MASYDKIADLPLTIDGYDLLIAERETSSDFVRTTTRITLEGAGASGSGEDVTYEPAEHHALHDHPDPLPLAGDYTFHEFSLALASLDLFPAGEPDRPVFHNHRRWGFESAALDLALKQAHTNLAAALDHPYRPVRFVVSTRLDDPPTPGRVDDWLAINPGLEFKLDATPDWTTALIDHLAATRAVRILDFKGRYEDTPVDQPPDPDLYERITTGFPDAIIEDPAITPETRPVLTGHEHRISWDAPITDPTSITDLPFEPAWLNIKPSRIGTVETLLATIEYSHQSGISLYGGGQFELGVGRQHLHALASLFYPDAPNDIAPAPYNEPTPQPGLPESPLTPPPNPRGLDWPHS